MRFRILAALATLLVSGPCMAQTITVANKPNGPEWADFGPVQLRYLPQRHEVIVTSTRQGRVYRWITRAGRYGTQLADSHCAPVWQMVRLTRTHLIYGVLNPRTGSGRITSVARSCLEQGGTCYADRTEL